MAGRAGLRGAPGAGRGGGGPRAASSCLRIGRRGRRVRRSALRPTQNLARRRPTCTLQGTVAAAAAAAQGAYELLVLLLGSVGPLGVGSNLLVLVLYLKFPRLRSPARLLLLNVSLDLLPSVLRTALAFAFRLRGGVVGGATNCVWDGFSNNLSGTVSIITLTMLACERYIGIIHNRVISFSWAWRAITYIWLYSLVWPGAPLLGRNRYILAVHVLGCAANWKSKDASDSSFVFFLFLGCMVVPVGVIAHCYGHSLYSIQKLRFVEDLQTIQMFKILRYEKKLAKMCFFMVFAFLVFWMPYVVICFLVFNGYGHLFTPTIISTVYLFAKSGTVYNPVIYIFMIRKFRRALLQLLCFRLLRCQPAKDLPAVGSEMQIQPIVMSQKDRDRPKKKVTFNSSSIIFIITNDESLSVDGDRTSGSVGVIQVSPL
ncbi:LOW QUALITY PROTEIN: opsin-3 [Megaptera novaeangliae]